MVPPLVIGTNNAYFLEPDPQDKRDLPRASGQRRQLGKVQGAVRVQLTGSGYGRVKLGFGEEMGRGTLRVTGCP